LCAQEYVYSDSAVDSDGCAEAMEVAEEVEEA
jgi:hypothetical protein